MKERNLLRAFDDRTLRIGVLMGGFSSEREISLRSGRAVVDGLRAAGFAAEAVDVKSRRIPALSSGRFDVFFIAMHGKFGEDGELQAILEKKQIPFTGSGSYASRCAMDKFAMKRVFLKSGVPTAPCWFYRKRSRKRFDDLPLPLVVKPRAEGSSIGVSIIDSLEELPAALEEAAKYGDDILLEEFVAGRELTVGILGETALPIIELRPKRRFFDFAAKYQDPETEYIVNPPLETKTGEEVQRIALMAHRALRCEGFSRVDLILSHDDGGKSPRIVVLEVNSIPGMTERSLVPKAARAIGITFPDLCCRIVRLALERSTRAGGIREECGAAR